MALSFKKEVLKQNLDEKGIYYNRLIRKIKHLLLTW